MLKGPENKELFRKKVTKEGDAEMTVLGRVKGFEVIKVVRMNSPR